MKSSTVLFMFELEHCINHVYFELCKNTYVVNEKFTIDSTLQIFCAKFMIKIQMWNAN